MHDDVGFKSFAGATHARGFNLIEVAVASAMAGVISIAAISAFASLNRQLVSLQAQSTANDSAKSVIDLLITEMQSVGGGAIRPWMAIWVENGASTNDSTRDDAFKPPKDIGSDRVTFATLIEAAPACTIVGMKTSSVVADIVGKNCCLNAMFEKASLEGSGDTLMLAYLVASKQHRQVALRRTKGCSAEILPGPLAVLDVLPGASTQTPDAGFVGGRIVATEIRTIFLSEGDLLMFHQLQNFSSSAPKLVDGTVGLVATNVHDLQVQLGYDTNRDSRISDDNALDDEWLFNVDDEARGVVAPSAGFDARTLRMVGIGVIIGVRAGRASTPLSARIVGGGVITSDEVWLRGAMGRVSLRNLFIFH